VTARPARPLSPCLMLGGQLLESGSAHAPQRDHLGKGAVLPEESRRTVRAEGPNFNLARSDVAPGDCSASEAHMCSQRRRTTFPGIATTL